MKRKKVAVIVLVMSILFALVPTMSVSASQADDLINVALGELHNTDGTKYGVTGAWCDAFIRWCADQANISTSVLPRLYGTKAYRNHANYRVRGTYTPKRGDIVILDWDFDNISDHVEIVTGVHDDGVYTIGGNTSLSSNSSIYGVETKTRYNYKSWGQILGYLEVNYIDGTSTSTTATRTNGTIEVQTSISNLTQSAQCTMAVYSSDGILLGNSVTDADSNIQNVTSYFPNYSNASFVKVFLWDSLNGMEPLTDGEKVNLT